MISSLSDSAEEKFRNSIIVLLTESDFELPFVFLRQPPTPAEGNRSPVQWRILVSLEDKLISERLQLFQSVSAGQSETICNPSSQVFCFTVFYPFLTIFYSCLMSLKVREKKNT